MRKSFLFWLVLWRFAFYSNIALSGEIRNLKTNDKAMAVVHLAMGQSTVLRFREKPKKVIVGNQNFFNIEFLENDLAIQPLGVSTSNLFVYGEYQTYGFILKVAPAGSAYDDLVNVSWKSRYAETAAPTGKKKTPPKLKSFKNINVKIGSSLFISVIDISQNDVFGVVIIDMKAKNLTPTKIPTKDIGISLTGNGETLAGQNTVFNKDEIEPGGEVNVRILLHGQKGIKSLSVTASFEKDQDTITIPEMLL